MNLKKNYGTDWGNARMKKRAMNSNKIILTCLITMLATAHSVPGLEVTRGPYLQTGTSTGMVVRWRTDEASDSRVRFGTDASSLTGVVSNAESVTEHIIFLEDLQPDTRYYYSIGSAEQDLTRTVEDHYFFTSPVPGTDKKTRVWILGDSGWGDVYHAGPVRDAYYAYADDTYTNVWLMLGDNAYPDGTDDQYQEKLFDYYPEMLRITPLWPSYGNHENYASNAGSMTGPYFDMFTLPEKGEAGGAASDSELWYSYDYGRIHFIVLGGVWWHTDRQMEWLKSDLEKNEQHWLVVYFHFPTYSFGSHNSDEEGGLTRQRQEFLPVLEEAGADLVLAGHSHNYERSVMIDGHYGLSSEFADDPESFTVDGGDGRVDGDGPYWKEPGPHQGTVYVVAGNGAGGGCPDPGHPIMLPPPAGPCGGGLILDVEDNRLDYKFLNQQGTVADSFTLIKGDPTRINLDINTNGSISSFYRVKSFPGGRVQLSFPEQGPFGAELYSLKGTLIASRQGNGPGEFFFDNPVPSRGLYLLKVTAGGKMKQAWIIAR